jgi:hypothetical protein
VAKQRGNSNRRNTAAESRAKLARNKARGKKLKLDMQIAKMLINSESRESIAERLGVSIKHVDMVIDVLRLD